MISRPIGRWALGAGFALLAMAVAAGWPGAASAAVTDQPPQPNIVLITTDDMPAEMVRPDVMPHLIDRIANRGTSFTDYIATTPLCCPARATLLTGQYGHNNGVLKNDYALLRNRRNVLPVWLRKAGYATAHVGKFLNGWGNFADEKRDVAPGWDRWFTQFERRGYYNWRAAKNGRMIAYGADDEDHLTEVVSRRAGRWAARMARRDDPFFLQVDYFAPHRGRGRDARCRSAPRPAPRDVGAFDDEPLPAPPSFNEADVSDKPSDIRARPLIEGEALTRLTERYRCALESLVSVDRGIERIFVKLKKARELARTVFVFTSDNGFFYGEHRIAGGKRPPYEANLRMPLLVRVPVRYLDGSRARQVDLPTAHLDVVPTLLELARAEPCNRPERCRTIDGRSLTSLLAGSERGWPANRALRIERFNCLLEGVRMGGDVYFERAPKVLDNPCAETAEVEHYDLGSDPFQLENLHPGPPGSPLAREQERLRRRMVRLAGCAGIAGRDPLPPSGVYCE